MEEKQKKLKPGRIRQILFLAAFFAVCAAFLIKTMPAEAATLSLAPASGSYKVGQTFTVNVLVSSNEQAMNAVSGAISFPKDKLEVIAVSKSGSIISLWVQEPSFSNSSGVVNFEGIVLNPGFSGSGGKVLTVNFKVKGSGSVSLTFSSSSILANDGLGTNILSGVGSSRLTLESPLATEKAEAEETAEIIPAGKLPSAPRIISSTHADTDKWYSAKVAEFSWGLPQGVIAVSLLVGKNSASEPTVIYSPAISYRKITNLTDGIWYFHARFKSAAGWGPTAHFRLQIDSENPENLTIKEVARPDLSIPQVKFNFTATDKLSGIDYFEIQADANRDIEIWKDDGSHIYETPVLVPSTHQLTAKVFDKAGNYIEASTQFTIGAPEPPIITSYPKKLKSGEPLIIVGRTYPESQIIIWFQKEDKEWQSEKVKSDGSGEFRFTFSQKLGEGVYKLWAELLPESGAQSSYSEKVTVLVEQPAILKVGSQAVTIMSVFVPLLALVLLVIFLIFHFYYKIARLKTRVKKEASEAEQTLSKSFDLLRADVAKQIRILEKMRLRRQLTDEEEGLVRQLKKDLNDSEKIIRKEVRDITRAVK